MRLTKRRRKADPKSSLLHHKMLYYTQRESITFKSMRTIHGDLWQRVSWIYCQALFLPRINAHFSFSIAKWEGQRPFVGTNEIRDRVFSFISALTLLHSRPIWLQKGWSILARDLCLVANQISNDWQCHLGSQKFFGIWVWRKREKKSALEPLLKWDLLANKKNPFTPTKMEVVSFVLSLQKTPWTKQFFFPDCTNKSRINWHFL